MSPRIEKLFLTPGPQPNGLQAAPDGLWVIDQRDNCVYRLSYEDGSVLLKLQTEADRASGITLGGGHVWIASTYDCRLLKLDPATGRTVATYDTPGAGVVAWQRGAPDAVRTGAHGLEWVDGKLWVATPPAQTIYQVEPPNMTVIRSFPTPGGRPHGLAWDGDFLWLADTSMMEIHKLDPSDGHVVDTIEVSGPPPHGMTIHEGALWYCDAETRQVCRIALEDTAT